MKHFALVVAVSLAACAPQPVHDNAGYPLSQPAYQVTEFLRHPDRETLRALLVPEGRRLHRARADWVFARLATGVLPVHLQEDFIAQVAEFDFFRAQDYAERLQQLFPTSVFLTSQVGLFRAWQGDYGEAEQRLQEALARDARDRRALSGLADIALWQGRREAAQQRLQTYLALYPGDRKRARRYQVLAGRTG